MKFITPIVVLLQVAVVAGIAPYPGCPVALHKEQKEPAVCEAILALSNIILDELFPKACTKASVLSIAIFLYIL